ncbi:MAG: GNAT family N-acetyltransferase, partial [Myxococcota bacterium]
MLPLRVNTVDRIAAVDAPEWDALVDADDPFVEHAFLAALERSGSVGADRGWAPHHVLVRDGGRLVAAAPLYVKTDSFGEYIFDWAWARAANGAGIPYYPKLVSAVPFTPASGRRLLAEGGATDGPALSALVGGIRGVAEEIGASSIHLLFMREAEQQALAREHQFLPRLTYQFHWQSDGAASFDEWLGSLRATARKQVRRERRQVAEAGLRVRAVRGAELDDGDVEALRRFYRGTIARHGGRVYLTPAFFDELRGGLAPRVLAIFALRGETRVAGALAFEKGRALYGRTWGADEDVSGLHFELCYYRLIEHALAHGLTRIEAGAQGEHKL